MEDVLVTSFRLCFILSTRLNEFHRYVTQSSFLVLRTMKWFLQSEKAFCKNVFECVVNSGCDL